MSGNNCSVTRCHILEERIPVICRMSHRFVLKTFFLRVAHNKNLLIHLAASFPAFRTHRKCRNARTHAQCVPQLSHFFRLRLPVHLVDLHNYFFRPPVPKYASVTVWCKPCTFVIIIVIMMTITIIGILPCMGESRTASRVWCGILK